MSDENNVVPFSKDPDDEKARRVIAEAQRLARLPRDDWQAQLSDCAKSLDIEQGELAKHIEAEHKTRGSPRRSGLLVWQRLIGSTKWATAAPNGSASSPRSLSST
jgi:hypothetical protein